MRGRACTRLVCLPVIAPSPDANAWNSATSSSKRSWECSTRSILLIATTIRGMPSSALMNA